MKWINFRELLKGKPSALKAFTLGQKGAVGTAVATGVLEGITQVAEIEFNKARFQKYKMFQAITKTLNHQIWGNLPLTTGNVDVRDGIVLLPAGFNLLQAVRDSKSRKKHLIDAGVGLGTKIILRNLGLNGNMKKAVTPQEKQQNSNYNYFGAVP